MCTACPAIPETTNAERTEQFEQRFINALNDAAMIVMSSVGHRCGLFDAMAGAPALTSNELATRAGLDERYVREWLGAMVCSGVVEIDPIARNYRLPAEHARLVTRAGDANLAVFAQYITLSGTVEDDIVECFRNGGGVPYSRYGRFHEVMAEDSGQSVLPALQSAILPLMPDVATRLRDGLRMLDVGCGRGKALLQLAAAYPKSRFTGYDLSDEAIGWARAAAERHGLTNLTLEVRDLSDFDATAPARAFDFITTFDAVHDQARPLNVLKGIRRALAPDGVYLAQDIKGTSDHALDRDNPIGMLLYTISCMHCMTVSLAQGGEGLGAMWGRAMAERYFAEAGFGSVEVHELAHDIQNYYYVCRP